MLGLKSLYQTNCIKRTGSNELLVRHPESRAWYGACKQDSIGRSEQIVSAVRNSNMSRATSLHISRRIRFSREMWLNRLEDRPQGNSQSIAPDYYLKADRSICDGTFFLKVNRYKPSSRDDAQECFYDVYSFRNHVAYATVFVKYAG